MLIFLYYNIQNNSKEYIQFSIILRLEQTVVYTDN